MSKGTLFIVSAPSGAGKTSLIAALLKQDESIKLSVSHTTRKARAGEVDGINYFFVDEPEFKQKIEAGDFIEYARVFDNYYGTTEQSISTDLANGFDVIVEIDWQGAKQVRNKFQQCQSIFIIPPSRLALQTRLRGRAQDSDEVIEKRLKEAVNEMQHYKEFDYLIVNDEFNTALDQLQAIFIANRVKREVQDKVCASLLQELLATDTD